MLMAFFSWWYGEGWIRQVDRVKERLARSYDYFSFSLILKTLFSPFRQISAGSVDGPLNVKFRAFIDRLVSRFVGAMVRIFVLVIGVISIIFSAVFGICYLILWPLIPAFPLIGFAMTSLGWLL